MGKENSGFIYNSLIDYESADFLSLGAMSSVGEFSGRNRRLACAALLGKYVFLCSTVRLSLCCPICIRVRPFFNLLLSEGRYAPLMDGCQRSK